MIPWFKLAKIAVPVGRWLIDQGFAIAEYVDDKLTERKRARRGLPHKQAQDILDIQRRAGQCPKCHQAHPSNATCPFRTAKTIIVPRRPPQ
jgi:hypothetical protein